MFQTSRRTEEEDWEEKEEEEEEEQTAETPESGSRYSFVSYNNSTNLAPCEHAITIVRQSL